MVGNAQESWLECNVNGHEDGVPLRSHRSRGRFELPGSVRLLVQRLLDHLKELDRQVGELETKIQQWHRSSDASSKLAQIPGIGPITASALVASLGDAKNFDSGRQVAAWLGLVRCTGAILTFESS